MQHAFLLPYLHNIPDTIMISIAQFSSLFSWKREKQGYLSSDASFQLDLHWLNFPTLIVIVKEVCKNPFSRDVSIRASPLLCWEVSKKKTLLSLVEVGNYIHTDSFAAVIRVSTQRSSSQRKNKCCFTTIRELKQRRFWRTHVNRKWAFLPFYMPWR